MYTVHRPPPPIKGLIFPSKEDIIGVQGTDPTLAVALTEQLFANAMVSAGLVDDPRSMLNNINNLLTMVSVKEGDREDRQR